MLKFLAHFYPQILLRDLNHILFEDTPSKGPEIMGLAELKKDIAGARPKNVDSNIKKIQLLQQVVSNTTPLKYVDRKLLQKYYDRIMVLSPSDILKFRLFMDSRGLFN